MVDQSLVSRYFFWLRNQAPASDIEPFPVLDKNNQTSIPNVFVAGDLSGIPLLKFASKQGTNLVDNLVQNKTLKPSRQGQGTREQPYELLIIGAGAAGISAALAASRNQIQAVIVESSSPFATIADFPKGKPIFLNPEDIKNESDLNLEGEIKEDLLQGLLAQAQGLKILSDRARGVHKQGSVLEVKLEKTEIYSRVVILAMGRSGDVRRLGVPGENLLHVSSRLIDPMVYCGKRLLIVGGGNSAVEAAIACAESGAIVFLSWRGLEFTKVSEANRVSLDLLVQKGLVTLLPATKVTKITDTLVEFKGASDLPIDSVLIQIGRAYPTQFLKDSGIRMNTDWSPVRIVGLILVLLFFTLFYLWKKAAILPEYQVWDMGFLPEWMHISAPFIYGFLYSLLVIVFGYFRVKRTPTPYIRAQTLSLVLIQVFPLFILPTLLFPWLDYHSLLPQFIREQVLMLEHGVLVTGDNAWRSYGLILAWPLFPFNWMMDSPSWFWLIYGFCQSFIVIPLLVLRYGKGAYCGWICSCGALAETVGDSLRTRTPHGPFWKNLEFCGQIVLGFMGLLTLAHVPSWFGYELPYPIVVIRYYLFMAYVWGVDFLLSSVLGIGLYAYFGGRFWCRLFCPLAAMMHIFARFSRFAILSRKERCISCGVCSKTCHQGISVMEYAQKGKPMDDVQCVGCSACIVECPTDVLEFGRKS
ncbi:MAG: NAD(P)-binding domain-containing protein [Candidatus Cloacimonetes bacterium]|nr:NAD(P)-binding domain-containing protein [Candidatus Cloacimonadota bacterium]